MTEFLSYEHKAKEGITILTVKTPVIDVNVMKEVHAAVSSSDSPKVILVLRLVSQILHASLYEDQEGLGLLIMLYKQMNNDGRRLALADLDPAVNEAFRMMRLDQVFEIHADANAAIRAMQQ
jgi:anti-anti-sigma factor